MLAAALAGVGLVLNAAGPFLHSAAPLAQACLAAGVHYLDFSNELQAFRTLCDLDDQARQAGVTIMPGVGFGVIATTSENLPLGVWIRRLRPYDPCHQPDRRDRRRSADAQKALTAGVRSITSREVHPVGRFAAADQDDGHHLRREQTVIDDPGRRRQPDGQRRRVIDWPVIVGDHAAVRAQRDVAR